MGVVFAAVAFVALGGYDWVRVEGNVEEFLTDTGALGPIVFVLVMWVTQPLGVPGFAYMAPAGVIWSWPFAIALVWTGNMGASLIAFAFARWIARDWASEHIPRRMAPYYDRLGPDAVGPVIVVRLLFGQLPPADWLLGLTRVTTRTFVIGTAIGIIPGIVIFVIAGGSILDALGDLRPPARLAAIVAIVVAAIVVRRRRAARAADSAG